jgi:hypothetical protein
VHKQEWVDINKNLDLKEDFQTQRSPYKAKLQSIKTSIPMKKSKSSFLKGFLVQNMKNQQEHKTVDLT